MVLDPSSVLCLSPLSWSSHLLVSYLSLDASFISTGCVFHLVWAPLKGRARALLGDGKEPHLRSHGGSEIQDDECEFKEGGKSMNERDE